MSAPAPGFWLVLPLLVPAAHSSLNRKPETLHFRNKALEERPSTRNPVEPCLPRARVRDESRRKYFLWSFAQGVHEKLNRLQSAVVVQARAHSFTARGLRTTASGLGFGVGLRGFRMEGWLKLARLELSGKKALGFRDSEIQDLQQRP